MSTKRLFIVWKIYQRRAESIAHHMDCEVRYYHYKWEEKSKVLKALSYIIKSIQTFIDLYRVRPTEILVQLPPTPALYVVLIYTKLTSAKFIADCHNAMIDGNWIRWPFALKGLSRAKAIVVHNDDIQIKATSYGLKNVFVAHDPLPEPQIGEDKIILSTYGLAPGDYVIVPWNFAPDEPIEAFARAASQTPEVKFVATWFKERLSQEVMSMMPENVIFTGYLDVEDFNVIFAHAGAALSLTIREGTQPSAASEAIAFGVPLILSKLETATRLYGDHVVKVENEPDGISAGVIAVFNEKEKWCRAIRVLKSEIGQNLAADINRIKESF